MFDGTTSSELTPRPFSGLTVKPSPEQIGSRIILPILGTGSTSTVTLNGSPSQFPSVPDVGVTKYVTDCTIFNSFVRTWLISDWGPEDGKASGIPESTFTTTHS